MNLTAEQQAVLESTVLLTGSHEFGFGFCAMELVAFIAGEPHSDNPQCACPVLAAFVRKTNDKASNGNRQKLKVLLPHLIGSRSTQAVEQKRAFLLADYAVRKWSPRSLRAAGLEAEALTMESLAPIVDAQTAKAAANVAANAACAANAADYAAAAAAADYAANAADYAADAADYAADAAARAAAAANAYAANAAANAAVYCSVPIEEQIAAVMEALKIGDESGECGTADASKEQA